MLVFCGFAAVINPFELPICQMIKAYDFQNLIQRNKMKMDLNVILATKSIESGDPKRLNEFNTMLSKRDNL